MTDKNASRRLRLTRRGLLKGLGAAAGAAWLPRGLRAALAEVDTGPGAFSKAVDFVTGEFEAQAFPGAALTVTRNGKVLLEKFWGTYCGRDDRAVPCDASMVNMLYSVSKLVTSTVVVMAGQDGAFDYDAPVSKYIPEFTGGGKETITVRHLLTHSAGLPGVPLKAVATPEKWEAAVAALCAAQVEWEPGSKCAYHGLTGHFLAAEVVRRCRGRASWEEICRELLFDPLGAPSLGFHLPEKPVPVALTPLPPAGVFEAPGFRENVEGHPAGSGLGTSADVLKILQLHLNHGTWEGKRLIKPEALREMHRIQYASAIEAASKEGKGSPYQSWGLGILMRGNGPADGGHGWFGMAETTHPGIFGHAGIDTIIAVADPELDAALVFLTTDSPKPMSKVAPLRSGVTARAFAALG